MRVLALVLVSAALGVQSDAISPAAVAKHIEQELTAARVPGAAIVVVSGDEIFAGSYGVADAEHQTAMTPATLLQAGSLTKLFTALGVAATLESRQLPYDTRLGQVMTGLGPQAATATFHQLLSQTSGLRDRSGDNGASDEAALAAAARGLGAADFILPAGLVFSYSNPGYALAGAGLEAIRKQPYADALHDTTLAPLGMTQSTLRLTQVAARPHAVGHRLDGASTIALRTPNNDTRIWPAGYLWTNAADMSRALSALVSRGAVAGQRGLPPSVIARVSTPHAPMPNIFVDGHYGYGLMIFRDRNTLMFEHGGTNAGFSSMLRRRRSAPTSSRSCWACIRIAGRPKSPSATVAWCSRSTVDRRGQSRGSASIVTCRGRSPRWLDLNSCSSQPQETPRRTFISRCGPTRSSRLRIHSIFFIANRPRMTASAKKTNAPMMWPIASSPCRNGRALPMAWNGPSRP
jgi:CubicO group peptidase (beta-lactamase class C family)